MALFKKQQQITDLEAFRDITDDVIEKDFVPYACHWTPDTIATKNGELLQFIKITGFTHERLASDSDDDADLRSKIRQAILTCIPSTKYAVWVHTIRRQKNLQTQSNFKRNFAGYLNRFWNERNDWEHQYTNEVYLTIVREGEGADIGDGKVLARGILPGLDRRKREEALDIAQAELSAVVDKMLPILERFGAQRLTTVQKNGVYYSEPCGFLGRIISMLDLEFPVAEEDLSQTLTDYDVTFGFNAMEVRMRADGRRRFGAILTIKEYRELPIDSLDKLLQIPARFIISQCFDFINAKAALAGFQYQKDLFTVSKASALSERTGLTDIMASNRGRPLDFGLHQINIFILDDSVKGLEVCVSKTAEVLTSLGMLPMREDIKFEECYWAQLPGNFEFLRRMRPINTARIGGLAHLTNFPAGQKDGNYWGPAVTTLHTAAGTPYFFSFHEGANGHTTLVGPFGAGKTVLLNFLLAQSCKFDPLIFFFDKDRGSEIFLRSLGATYVNPHPKTNVPDYARVKLNPFQIADSPANRQYLSDWLLLLAGGAPDAEFSAACAKAVGAVMGMPKEARHLASCVKELAAIRESYGASLSDWVAEGAMAAWFGAEDTLAFTGKVSGFDMAEVVTDAKALVPVLSYLLHRVSNALTGSPAILVMDEAWTLLETPLFAQPGKLKEWLIGLSKRNAMAILATERLEEARKSPINAELMKHIASQIYLPDEAADESYVEAFGLNEKEIGYLSMMNTEDRHFLFKRGLDTIVLELDLSGMSDIIAVLSADPLHLQAMDHAIATDSLTPARWMPKFLEMI